MPKFEHLTFKLNGVEIIFSLGSSLTFSRTSFCAKPNYMVQIYYNSKTNIATIMKDITILKRFFTFAMHTETEIKSMDCTIDNEFRLLNKIEVFSKSFNENIKDVNPFNILINFEEIENKEDILKKWFKINEKYKPLFEIYFMNFSKPQYDEYRFLSYAQSLESYLRKNEKYIDNYMDSNEYEDIKKELDELIKNSKMDEDHKSSWKSRIKFGNEISLRKRLKLLINDLMEFETTNKIIDENKSKFISNVVDTRNYYTHYDESSNYEENAEKLIILNYKLELLIELIILKELGFNNDEIDKKFERYGNINV